MWCWPPQTQNTVYEIVSDMSTRQDSLEERLVSLEDKLTALQEQLDMLPEALTRALAQHAERMEQRRNFLHPDTAVALAATPSGVCGSTGGIGNTLTVGISGNISSTAHHPLASLSNSPLLPHSRSVPSAPSTMSLHPWPASPVLPPVSSRTPHLVPDTGSGNTRQTQQQQQHQLPTSSQSATRLTAQGGIGGIGTQGSDTSPHS